MIVEILLRGIHRRTDLLLRIIVGRSDLSLDSAPRSVAKAYSDHSHNHCGEQHSTQNLKDPLILLCPHVLYPLLLFSQK